MTQADPQPIPTIETLHLRGADADELARDVGCLVAQVGPTRGESVWVEEGKADRLAEDLTRRHPDRMYAVMTVRRVYHGPQYQTPTPAPESEGCG